jgi:agmatinase
MPERPALIGVPYDASSSFLRGAAGGPRAIREALASPAGNPYTEALVRVVPGETVDDLGDLTLSPGPDTRAIIEDAIRALAHAGRPFLALGGDHSITYPILRGLAPSQPHLTILQIDAHPDLYDEFEGDRYSHACPFARIMEEGLASRLVQVGIRAMTGPQFLQASRFGVEQIDMRAWSDGARPSVADDIYLSIDLDGIDPSFAPGVSHPEPGGLTVRDVVGIIHTLNGRLIGADVVELNPSRDPAGLTAGVAAKLVRELAGRFLADGD